MAKGFIFDLDGTLADSMPAHYQAWTLVAGRHGLVFPEDEFYRMGGVPTAKIAAQLVAKAGLALDPLDVAREKEQLYVTALTGGVLPVAPVVEIARRHRSEGPLAVASGGLRHLVEPTLAQLGIADWFAAVVCAEDTVRHKPDPDVFLEAARRIGVAPEDCTVYEDTDTGLEAARRAGMRGVDVRPLYLPRPRP